MKEKTERIGILGGGQLGWMLGIAARRLGLTTVFLDPAADCPVDTLGDRIRAPFDDPRALDELAGRCEVATFEFENVPATAVERLATRIPVRPGARSLELTQDRLTEKRFLRDAGVPVPRHHGIGRQDEIEAAVAETGLPAIMKTRRMGYDGKGQERISTQPEGIAAFERMPGEVILEAMIPFDFEASVLVVRSIDGETATWPPIANHHEGGILRCSRTPCPALTETMSSRMRRMAVDVAASLEHVGVLAIEFFIRGDEILANEVAPRVHNSGHVTLEYSQTDQFENHIRAVAGLPLGDTGPAFKDGVMFNAIGMHPSLDSSLAQTWRRIDGGGATSTSLEQGTATWYDYRKTARSGRKLGHLTLVDAEIDRELTERLAAEIPGARPGPKAWEQRPPSRA